MSLFVRVYISMSDKKKDSFLGRAEKAFWLIKGVRFSPWASLEFSLFAKELDYRLHKAISSPKSLTEILVHIGLEMRKHWTKPFPGVFIGIVRLLENEAEYYVLGDVSLIIDDGDKTRVIRDCALERLDREALSEKIRLQKEGLTAEQAANEIMPILRKNRWRVNKDFWAFNMEPQACFYAKTGRICTAKRILLASKRVNQQVLKKNSLQEMIASNESVLSIYDDTSAMLIELE